MASVGRTGAGCIAVASIVAAGAAGAAGAGEAGIGVDGGTKLSNNAVGIGLSIGRLSAASFTCCLNGVAACMVDWTTGRGDGAEFNSWTAIA